MRRIRRRATRQPWTPPFGSMSRCPSEAVLMLGDTPYDVRAAAKAGIRTVAFRCGGWTDSVLDGALMVYDGPADLPAHYDQSPLGRG